MAAQKAMSEDGPKTEAPAKLEYFISIGDSVLAISLIGQLSRATLYTFRACQAEVFQNKQARFVVLSFGAQVKIEVTAIPDLIVFQRQLRDRQRIFRICNLSDEQENLLQQHNAIDPTEVSIDLMDAMRKIQALKD